MEGWRLYYDDGAEFGEADGPPFESPPWGCIAIGRPGRILFGVNSDFFLYRSDLEDWVEVGDSGLVDHLAHFAHLITCVRPGRWIPDEEFKEFVRRVRGDWGV